MKYDKYHALNFLRQNKGAVAVSFAFMLPCLVGFYSLAFDGARFNSERSRLADALNQSVYAVAITDNRNATADDKTANVAKVESFLSYYLPDKDIDRNLIAVSERLNYDSEGVLTSVDYSVNADQITHPILNPLPESGKAAFGANITLRGNGLSGIARRDMISSDPVIPTDYVFVPAFSATDTGSRGYSDAEFVQKAIYQLGKKLFALQDGSTIGLVPYAGGVAVALDKSSYYNSYSKEMGCSYIAKMKGGLDSLDWNFWYNKPGMLGVPVKYYTYPDNHPENHLEEFSTSMPVDDYVGIANSALERHYVYNIAMANTTYSNAYSWLGLKGYCVKPTGGKYQCDADSKSNINNLANSVEFNKNLSNFLLLTGYDYKYGTILTPETVDIAGTLSGDYLFNEKNVKNFVAFMDIDPPFGSSCYRIAPGLLMSGGHGLGTYRDILKDIEKPAFYLLELSSNPDILEEINSMSGTVGVTNRPLWGLLRSVPVLAKGINKRKVIIVLASSGSDIGGGAGIGTINTLREDMMDNYALCDVIRDGLKQYPLGTPTISTSIYYISLNYRNGVLNNDIWEQSCVGKGNTFTANDINTLLSILGPIMQLEDASVSYINPKDI